MILTMPDGTKVTPVEGYIIKKSDSSYYSFFPYPGEYTVIAMRGDWNQYTPSKVPHGSFNYTFSKNTRQYDTTQGANNYVNKWFINTTPQVIIDNRTSSGAANSPSILTFIHFYYNGKEYLEIADSGYAAYVSNPTQTVSGRLWETYARITKAPEVVDGNLVYGSFYVSSNIPGEETISGYTEKNKQYICFQLNTISENNLDSNASSLLNEPYKDFFLDVSYSKDDDPYNKDGVSGGGGGTGTLDGTSDNIGIPALPTLSAVDTGFITLFNPSASQMLALSSYMWSNDFDLDTFKKVIANPIDAILGLSIVPVRVPKGGSKEITIGNISTGIPMTIASSQYVEVDCGTINVNEYWGAYIDYDPYTECSIYLPYCGTHAIKTDDIMGKAVRVVYHVDVLSGACTSFVQCGGSVLYTFIGHCSSSIPITSNDWTNVINGVLGIAGSIGNMVASGGITAPSQVTSLASNAINAAKPNIEKSGAMGGTGGMLGVQTPYLIVTRPNLASPYRQNSFTGYPSFITNTLGDLSGYTEIEKIHLEGIPATDSELDEIERLLKGGVIL